MRFSKVMVLLLAGLPVVLFFQNCSKFQVAEVDPSALGANIFQTPLTLADSSISANVFGSPLTISTTTRLAGAIGSLAWNGKEFINSDDHGRELQSASSFDGLGECFNPTEAGSGPDGSGSVSTSRLLGINAAGNVLQTTVQMAFWTQAGQAYPQGCGGNTKYTQAQNSTNLSNHTVSKKVTIGYAGIANAIEYLVDFHVPEHHSSAVFEALTGYMGGSFSSFWTFDPASGAFNSLTGPAGEQSHPLIFSTSDQNYAMGVYSPDLPQAAFSSIGYGAFNFASQNTMKWNAVFRTGDTPAGDYNYRIYVFVGNVSEVKQAMTSVYQSFVPQVMGNIDGISDINGTTYVTGWACSRTQNDSVAVHLYLNGPAGTGQFYTAAMANLGSESAVAQACQASGSNYRFAIPISQDMKSAYGGQSIYIHAISPVGAPNLTIGQSGVFRVPSVAAPAVAAPTVASSAPVAAPALPSRQSNYRFYKSATGEHFITNSYNEGVGAGYQYEGMAFNSFSAAANVSGATQIYRCLSSMHFVSNDSNCEGVRQEGSLGFLYGSQVANSAPVYRFFSTKSGDHLITTTYAEGISNGYNFEAILGYAPTN